MSNSFLIFSERVKKNIERIAVKAQHNNVVLRPHFKTHQNLTIAGIFKDFNISAITVSSVEMAQFFAQNGWKDIFIAFPLDINRIQELDDLSNQINLIVLINHFDHLAALEKIKNPLEFMVEIDVGYHRSGMDFKKSKEIISLIEQSQNLPEATFIGLSAHFGNSYIARNEMQIRGIGFKSINRLAEIGAKVERELGQYVYLSIGDTPTVSVLEQFPEVDELRPGNFVFYDMMQMQIGSCNLNQIAALMKCPVVSKNDVQHRLVIHGGAVHFSKEMIDFNGVKTFGHLVDISEDEWKLTTDYMVSLSQEHGIVQCNPSSYNNYKIGDYVYVLPIHSCLTANLMKNHTEIL